MDPGKTFKTTKKYVLTLIQNSNYDELSLYYTLNRLDTLATVSILLRNPRNLHRILVLRSRLLQYQSDAGYKFNAFIASDERVYRQQRTCLTLKANTFITEGKCI